MTPPLLESLGKADAEGTSQTQSADTQLLGAAAEPAPGGGDAQAETRERHRGSQYMQRLRRGKGQMSSDEDLKGQRGGGPGATGRPDQGGPGQGIPRGGGTMTGVFHRLPRDSGEQTGVGQGCPQLASERGRAASRCQRTGLGHGLHGWWTEGEGTGMGEGAASL